MTADQTFDAGLGPRVAERSVNVPVPPSRRRQGAAGPEDGPRHRGPLQGRLHRWGWGVVQALLVLGGEAYLATAPHTGALLESVEGFARPVLGLLVLLGVPTILIAVRFGWGGARLLERLLYGLGAALLGVMLAMAAANLVLPVLGDEQPLRLGVVLVVSSIANVTLALLPRRERRAAWVTVVDGTTVLAGIGVLLGVVGAIRLNNDAGSGFAIAAVVVALVVVVALLHLDGTRSDDRRTADALAVYLVALTLLLATSLRGWALLGHDSQREFLVFRLTEQSSWWRMESFTDAYNACLSITILPTVLAAVTGVAGLWVFKVVIPMLFAVVPVLVYLVARRSVSRRIALLGTLLLVGFPTFFTDMPYLARQEVAFVFYGVLLLAATQPGWSLRARRVAVLVAGVGVVISHYSTTYFLLMVLALGLLAAGGERAARRVLRRPAAERRAPRVLVSVPVVLGLAATAWLWSGPLTHTGGHLTSVLVDTVEGFLSGDDVGSSDRSYSLIFGDTRTDQERLDEYAAQTLEPDVRFPDAIDLRPAERTPTSLPLDDVPLTAVGGWLDDHGVPVATLQGLIRFAGVVLLQFGLVLGLLVVVRRFRLGRDVSADLTLVGVGSLMALGLQVLLPRLTVEYGVLRSFEQTLMVAGPFVVIGLLTLGRVPGWLLGDRKDADPTVRWQRGNALVVTAILTLVVSLTGLLPRALGGYPPQVNLSNAGAYYDLYYLHPEESAASRWLTEVALDGDRTEQVVSDLYTLRRLTHVLPLGQNTSDLFFPTLVRRPSFVLVGSVVAQEHRAYVYAHDKLVAYRYPMGALARNKSRVYDNGVAEVYR